MSSNNGGENGDRPSRHSSLDAVEQRIAARNAEEAEEAAALGALNVDTLPPPADEEESPPTEDDPLIAWKRRAPGKPVTLEQIHAGLIATCTYSEAAIEATVKMAQDIREVVQTVDDRTQQMALISTKVGMTNDFVHKVDEEVAAGNKILNGVRKDVQFLKDDIAEMRGVSAQLAAIKEMLVEILVRLPSPEDVKKPDPDPTDPTV